MSMDTWDIQTNVGTKNRQHTHKQHTSNTISMEHSQQCTAHSSHSHSHSYSNNNNSNNSTSYRRNNTTTVG